MIEPHVATNCALIAICTDVEGCKSVQSQHQMGKRFKTYNSGEQETFSAHFFPLSSQSQTLLESLSATSCETNYLHDVTVDSPVFFCIKFGQKTNEEKETEQFDGEVCES